jgi:hypothetical protein
VIDAVVVNSLDDTVAVLLGQGSDGVGTGGFGAPGLAFAATDPVSPVLADLDGDGIRDLVVALPAANALGVVRGLGSGGRGNGAFAAPVLAPVGISPRQVLAADFDGDALLDLAAADSGSGTISVLRGRGDGTFDPAIAEGVGGSPVALVAGHFDWDGRLDLVALDPAGEVVVVLRGGGVCAP